MKNLNFVLTVTEEKGKFNHVVTLDRKVVGSRKSAKTFSHVAIIEDKFGMSAIGFGNNPTKLQKDVEWYKVNRNEDGIVLTF